MRKGLSVSMYVWAVMLCLTVAVDAQNISTIAGGGPNNLSATSSSIGFPWATAVDGAGNTYISDNLSSRVFVVNGSGTLTVFAGNSVAGYTGDGGSAADATLNGPKGIAFDGSGNLYIADYNNSVIRVVNTNSSGSTTVAGVTIAAGNIATVAGNGTSCLSAQTTNCGDGGPAVGATLTGPSGVFVDSSGNVFIADTVDNRIREVSTSGTITTVAGNGTACSTSGNSPTCGDGGSATKANLDHPASVFVDSSGNIYVTDSGDNKIREVTASNGNIATVAGNGTACPSSTAACGDGGTATSAQLNLATAATTNTQASYWGAVTLDGSGNIYIADSMDNRVREVSGGTISTVAGNGNTCTHAAAPCGDGSAATSAQLTNPTDVLLNSSGDLLITTESDSAIRDVSSGTISTIAGIQRDQSFSGDGAPLATDAQIGQPPASYSDSAGNIFIVDTFNAAIRKLSSAGAISTVVGGEALCSTKPCGDGASSLSSVRLGYISDIFVDSSNNIFFADYEPSTSPLPQAVVRELPGGAAPVKLIAGQYGTLGYSGDGGAATSALLGGPATSPAYVRSLIKGLGMTLDKNGVIYIADTLNHAIRVVNPSTATSVITIAGVTIAAGDIATVAGDGTACSSSTSACGDGGAATSAQLNVPSGVAVDGSGNIYIADTFDNRIREVVASSGVIETIAGTGTPCSGSSCGDFGPAASAELNYPIGVQVDGSGNIFIADAKDAVVREVTASNGYIRTVAGNYKRGFSGDGGAATSAELDGPYGVAFDPSGNLLISDSPGWRVRKVSTITLGSTTNTLTSSANPSIVGQSVTFTATITSKTSSTPSGTVAFFDGGTALGSPVTLNSSGVATVVDSNLTTAVNHTITAVYSGDATFDGSTSSALTQAVTDFTVAAGTLSPTSISPGSTSTSTITLTAVNGFNSSVALTCSVSPTSSPAPTCSFSSSSVTPTSGGATSTLTISTTAATSMLTPGILPGEKHRRMFYAVWLLLPAMLFSTAGMGSRNRRKLLCGLLAALAIVGCLFLASCSSTGTTNNGGGGGNGGTPAGQYTITVTAAAGSDSKPVSPALTLTVQ